MRGQCTLPADAKVLQLWLPGRCAEPPRCEPAPAPCGGLAVRNSCGNPPRPGPSQPRPMLAPGPARCAPCRGAPRQAVYTAGPRACPPGAPSAAGGLPTPPPRSPGPAYAGPSPGAFAPLEASAAARARGRAGAAAAASPAQRHGGGPVHIRGTSGGRGRGGRGRGGGGRGAVRGGGGAANRRRALISANRSTMERAAGALQPSLVRAPRG